MKNIETLLTIDNVADLLKISAVTVRRLETTGKIKAIKAGGQIRFEPRDVEQYIKEEKLKRGKQNEQRNTQD